MATVWTSRCEEPISTFLLPFPCLRLSLQLNICHGCKRFISFKGGTPAVPPAAAGSKLPSDSESEGKANLHRPATGPRLEPPPPQSSPARHEQWFQLPPAEQLNYAPLLALLLAVILHLLTSTPKACPGHQLPPWVTFCTKNQAQPASASATRLSAFFLRAKKLKL